MCPIAVELNMSYFVFCKIKGSYPIIYTYFIIVLTASHNNLSCTLTLTVLVVLVTTFQLRAGLLKILVFQVSTLHQVKCLINVNYSV